MGVYIRGKLGRGPLNKGMKMIQHGEISWLLFSIHLQVLSNNSASSLALFWEDFLKDCLRPVLSRLQGHQLASDRELRFLSICLWPSLLSLCPFTSVSPSSSPRPHLKALSADPGYRLGIVILLLLPVDSLGPAVWEGFSEQARNAGRIPTFDWLDGDRKKIKAIRNC